MAETFDKTLTIEFDPPLKAGDVVYESLTFTEPTIGQVMKAETAGSGNKMTAALITDIGKVLPAAVKQIPISDFRRIDRFFAHFIPEDKPGPETGDTE